MVSCSGVVYACFDVGVHGIFIVDPSRDRNIYDLSSGHFDTVVAGNQYLCSFCTLTN